MNKKKDKQFYKVKNTNYNKYKIPIQQGWICPKCGAVMAPWMGYCINCKPIQAGTNNWKDINPLIPQFPDTYNPDSEPIINPNITYKTNTTNFREVPYTTTVTTDGGRTIETTHGISLQPNGVSTFINDVPIGTQLYWNIL